MFRKLLTLVIVQRDREILLGLKKRGFGKGKWNGFGGKVEPGETIQCAAARELQEESGLTAIDLEHVGVIEFEFVGDMTILEVHVFKTHKWSGNVSESDVLHEENSEAVPGRLWVPSTIPIWRYCVKFHLHETCKSWSRRELENNVDKCTTIFSDERCQTDCCQHFTFHLLNAIRSEPIS
ncbi:oxidized purine nucleoside triphosphate hydrolase-like isoform X1 [Schistocerca serialis cubense]|uniref:oxidized purine nucleoside triphosphate hydrolase-like isoform X1 n=1 Tax=Schistocerca serialis cubense TaxID=2023355 RepID=UPI00214F2CCC|nr:oxidized purine nucleoside triphosphate hydrolase-like isoform X1 [Schistocerca serialis cubense]XP_049950370.1 oxidized purine nucleoside triphosphate hydrolase-like isoform X1 [Schistocerca serialis cubense]XP_049950371.1 oxidized purine nucleoside triphosphate hydrolase-like isoform X1 [Schistocerca serialis cubense]XP_049950372.1 oxidized purine nucleoside triphosphate hydrolase-like isoform X1 [Schistocerca serialis cubense]